MFVPFFFFVGQGVQCEDVGEVAVPMPLDDQTHHRRGPDESLGGA